MGDIGDACFGAVAAWAVGGGVRRNQVFIPEFVDSFLLSVFFLHSFILHVSVVLVQMIHSLFLKPQVFELPENAGIPVGGVDSDTYYRLEIHYNNQKSEAGKYYELFHDLRNLLLCALSAISAVWVLQHFSIGFP